MKLRLRAFSGPSHGAHNTQASWPKRSGVLVELRAGSLHGLGEASPLPGYSPDTLQDTELALAAIDLAALERALRIDDTEAALSAAANLLPTGLPAARMALETAALDLRGWQRNLSAPALLGAQPAAKRALAWGLGSFDDSTLPNMCRAAQRGYQHFKLKLGRAGGFPAELAGIHAMRRRFGAGLRLRLDANRAWSPEAARSACAVLEPLGIEFIEEPCAHLDGPLGTRVCLALDESLQGLDPQQLERAARRAGASVVVLKPTALGGLSRCLEWARHAKALNLGVLVSHTFEGPVALRSAAALALAIPTDLAQGLAPHSGLDAWPHIPLPIDGATLRIWNSPGLGLPGGQFP